MDIIYYILYDVCCIFLYHILYTLYYIQYIHIIYYVFMYHILYFMSNILDDYVLFVIHYILYILDFVYYIHDFMFIWYIYIDIIYWNHFLKALFFWEEVTNQDGIDSQDFLVEKIREKPFVKAGFRHHFLHQLFVGCQTLVIQLFGKNIQLFGISFVGKEMQKPPGKRLDLPMAVKLEKLLRCMWLWSLEG